MLAMPKTAYQHGEAANYQAGRSEDAENDPYAFQKTRRGIQGKIRLFGGF